MAQEWISLDGCASGPGGEEDIFAAVPDPAFAATQRWNQDLIDDVDFVLLGRTTYELFVRYWPAADEPIAARINEVAKAVCSRTLEEAPWGEFVPAAVERDPLEHLRTLRRDDAARTVLVWGSLSIVHQLAQAGELDELDLFVAPVVLGEGTALLPQPRTLRQLTVEEMDGVVHARYALES